MVNTEFGLHELAIEDAVSESQRPKLDHYATHLFLSAYAVSIDLTDARLDASEIAVFITDQALITVRKDDRFDITPILARWDASPDLAKHGVAFLLYGLLDHLVDGHFTAVRQIDEGIEHLEDLLFDGHRLIQVGGPPSRPVRLRLAVAPDPGGVAERRASGGPVSTIGSVIVSVWPEVAPRRRRCVAVGLPVWCAGPCVRLFGDAVRIAGVRRWRPALTP
jgi:hypothetical protein